MKMVRQIVTVYSSVLLVLLLALTNFIEAQNDVLECMIKDGENEIHLKLQPTEQLLANKNLPIWIARSRRSGNSQRYDTVQHKRIYNFIKKNFGSFTLYHDKEKSAALVYFQNREVLMGVIDTRYMITHLPLNECHQGHQLGGNYVKELRWSSLTKLRDHLKPADLSSRSYKQVPDDVDKPTTLAEQDPETTLYPEIMLFLPHSIKKILQAKHGKNHLAILVGHFIVYFNAIDMLISKLATDNIKIRLNLAGIVVEAQENVFNFMKLFGGDLPQGYQAHIPRIDAVNTLINVPQYIFQNSKTFPQDSFDFFFIVSNTFLWSTALNGEAAGITSVGDIYERRRSQRTDGFLSGIIVSNIAGLEYITPSHEIAHLISIGHDPSNKGYRYRFSQCYAIMQTVNSYCPDCLKWSDESIEQLKKYARNNQNRCYLLNSPRSLHPYGFRMRTLSSSDQCRCYGFEPPISNHLTDFKQMNPKDFCNNNLNCDTGPNEGSLPLPVDGTPCSDNRVCWNKACLTAHSAP